MFSDKKEKRIAAEPGSAQNRINEGTKLKGDVSSTGFFRIDGTVEGNVKTPSKVVLGKTGVIIGTLTCENADIEGRFEGNLQVSGTLSLRATAIIEGDVTVGKLAVEPGATMNASCVMQDGKSKSTPTSNHAPAENSKAHPFDRQQRMKKATVETDLDD
ncbi:MULTISPECIES: polymer-forming cytoskeletal protein [Aequorivita]|uniref:Polymer-forming cytoskeletal protein n=1 Tax=Aequorivita iocasae TaxID=2803865 RepID=A0ABX7DVJ2_9FLAO|nr:MULTISPECIES: polymer-forming cytoskeletal protein [Aequorivita]QQX77582.1 polymer-forming cytoskeletal protein [Aequorivita iocasae]UCA57076.1 polymer-forming cytoskeletal protein [Aequorivita sp. F7]